MTETTKKIIREAKAVLLKRRADNVVRGGIVNGRTSLRPVGAPRGKGWEPPHGSFSDPKRPHPASKSDTTDPNWI
jgi:hypothetical protein